MSVKMNVAEEIVIDDTTLRDGEQSAGVAFTPEEKINIACSLSNIGVPELEIGIPAMGEEEQEVMKSISTLNLPSRLIAWCRMTDNDLEAAQKTGVDMIDVSIPVSDQQISKKLNATRTLVKERVHRLVKKGRDLGFDICVGCEDASRADQSFICEVANIAEKAGARRIRYADTLGILEPFSTKENISYLRKNTGLEIEIHAHDDFGLATANTLAAVQGGARFVNTTVNGLGERAGNAPLEEVVMALKHLHGRELNIDLKGFSAISQLVGSASGRPVSWQKSIVGEGVFCHESGIHVDGLIKSVENYQSIDPKELGKAHTYILGKHSGSRLLDIKFKEMGITLKKWQKEKLLSQVRKFSMTYKRSPSNNDLIQFFQCLG